MRRALTIIVLATVGLTAAFQRSIRGCGDDKALLEEFARQAVSADAKSAEAAIQTLRSQGPEGLKALLATSAEMIKKHTDQEAVAAAAAKPVNADDPDEKAWQRLRTALDEVSGQRDCHASRLFWYTDLEEAKRAAKHEGKPILSLRLLGKLTDEYSCANSRFFRTTLYSNAEISKVLGDRFILHWKSVRPVPKVTIDFGDGRKLERTLTGNSIHYVLDADGQVIDALPGLYGPKAFLRELDRAETMTKKVMTVPREERAALLVSYHRDREAAIAKAWQEDLNKLGISASGQAQVVNEGDARVSYAATTASGQPTPPSAIAQANAKAPPKAAAAGRLAASKWDGEAPIIKAAAIDVVNLTKATTDDVWNRIALLHAEDAKLDAASFNLIRSQHPAATVAGRRAMTKMKVEDPLVRMVRNLQGSISLDTVRNEYTFHRQIHQWLAAGNVPELDAFNERVYAELFLTPSSDPWLGLMPSDAYTALENNGVKDAPQVAKTPE